MNTTIEKPTLKEQAKLVGLAFDALNHVFYNKSTNYVKAMLGEALSEEKGHRGFGDDFAKYHPNSATVMQCAKMMCVNRVAGYLRGEKLPGCKDFLHIQRSAFYAGAIAIEFGEEILLAWQPFTLAQLAELDYLHFVSPEKFEVQS